MTCRVVFILGLIAFAVPAMAQTPVQSPFTTTLSNIAPLVFGMTVEDATSALGTPLVYVEGEPGSEVFVTIRHVGGSGLSFRNDPLFLQFRDGRLTGWKGDWRRKWHGSKSFPFF